LFRGSKRRLARWLFLRPIVPFAIEFVVLAPLLLADTPTSGRATRDGFRVGGRASATEIRKAFNQVRRVVRDGDPLPYISRTCGSNRITALGLALLLLLGVALICLLARPPLAVRALALAAVVVFFVVMRHGVGNWIQGRFFMATDFEEVSLRHIRAVKADPMERQPVHFVATIVRAKPQDAV
jgi:hypothetical protein